MSVSHVAGILGTVSLGAVTVVALVAAAGLIVASLTLMFLVWREHVLLRRHGMPDVVPWPRRALPVIVTSAIVLIAIAAVSAGVDEKISAPSDRLAVVRVQQDDPATSSVASSNPPEEFVVGEIKNFVDPASFRSRTLNRAMCLVRYYSAGSDRAGEWWTPCGFDKTMATMAVVREQLALPKAWGVRDRRAEALIPAGTNLKYVFGKAAAQCEPSSSACYSGGGRQLLFPRGAFRAEWITATECRVEKSDVKPKRFSPCKR